MEKSLREETRKRLKWCLDQDGEFTIQDCAEYFGLDRSCIGSQFYLLEKKGVLAHRRVYKRQLSFWVKDKSLGERLVGIVSIEPRKMVELQIPRINSVFALGSL